jgi:phosphoglycerate dehydrogenase-like enzyme
MIAESILGAVFYFLKAFHFSKKMQFQKKWARAKISKRLGSLKGSRVTILGFGNIGQCVGKFLKPYGCVITGIKRTFVKGPDYFKDGDRVLTVDKISEVLATTDHLVLVLPGGVETQGLLTYELLSKLPYQHYKHNYWREVYSEARRLKALVFLPLQATQERDGRLSLGLLRSYQPLTHGHHPQNNLDL